MNKLYDAIESVVIDDELLKKALEQNKKEGNDNFSSHIEHNEVEVLNLSFRKIRRIANLVGFQKLTKLQLDNNAIEKIENLGHLQHLEWLDLSFNKIKKIEGLENLSKLTDLSLFNNQITKLENMDCLTSLTVFSIGKNQLEQLDNVLYLRRFDELAVLIFSGNPVCTQPDYKPYILSHIKNLKYLDYRLVDETAVQSAKEQYHEEIRELLTLEEASEKLNATKREKQEKLEVLRTANLQDFDSMFTEEQENEMSKLKVLSVIKEAYDEYRERQRESVQVFLGQMLQHHAIFDKEKAQFKLASGKVQRVNDDKCIHIIEEFNAKKKQVIKSAKSSTDLAQGLRKLDELKKSNETMYDRLMDQETQLVEQFEEFLREFETRMSELLNASLEAVRSSFAKMRETETMFHDKITTFAMQEMQKFNKNEVERELTEDEKNLLSDKETILNLINSFHDVQTSYIESKEDDMTKLETRLLEQTITKEKQNENKRNSDRVSEVYSFVQMQAKTITNAFERDRM